MNNSELFTGSKKKLNSREETCGHANGKWYRNNFKSECRNIKNILKLAAFDIISDNNFL